MSFTYADVDRSEDPAAAAADQLRVDARDDVAAYKARALELLGQGAPLLDVGCGPGHDLGQLGGRCVGLDPSQVMCDAAATRGAVARGDGRRLPFRDGSFAGVRADRVLQHLIDPELVLDEMVRVARPGGRIVVADPDQESLVIHVPGVALELVDRVKALRRDVGYRNGRQASRLPHLLLERGLFGVTCEAFPLLVLDAGDAFGLRSWPRHWSTEGHHFNADELSAWEAALDPSPPGFLYAVTVFVAAGSVPG